MSRLFADICSKLSRRAVYVLLALCACTIISVPVVEAKAPTKQSSTKKSSAKKSNTKKSSAKKSTSKSGTQKKQTEAPLRQSGEVRKEKQRTEKEIADTKKKLTDNEKRTRSQLERLNDLDSQIERQQSTIDELNQTIDELRIQSDILTDSIQVILQTDSVLRKQIAEGLRQQHVQRMRITPLAFVTAGASMTEMRQRLNYLNVMQHAHQRLVSQLRQQRRNMESVRFELDSVQASHNAALKQLSTAKNILDGRRRESERVVNDLRKESASLNKMLQDKQRKLRQLDDELNRIILEEQRRAEEQSRRDQSGKSKNSSGKSGSTSSNGRQGTAEAERALTGSFDRNKGKLLFPVAGKYTIVGTFGRSRHEQLNHVQVDNSGIDISVAAGTKARSVFDGTVSSIFFMDGFENIIIVRHGNYLTVYAGLSSINVRKGEAVKTGQTLGTIATIDGNTVLHFEVRNERTKLNPLDWVK